MKKIIVLGILVLTPAVAFAQNLDAILTTIGDLVTSAIPIVAALALLYFFWGLGKYILSAGDEEKKKEGRDIMIWGVIALFVMVSIWGLVNVLGTSFGVGKPGSLPVPTLDSGFVGPPAP